MPKGSDPFLPLLAEVAEVRDLTPDIKLLRLSLREGRIDYRPGQFAILSAFGVGEAPFTFASLPEEGLEFAIRRMGTVTNALHNLGPGDLVGIRGPYGNTFPLEDYEGKDIIIIGGGIGIAPLRPLIHWFIKHRGDYGSLLIIYGARTPRDFAFSDEFDAWAGAGGARLELAIDPPGSPDWRGRVALVPAVVKELKPSPKNSIAITCGPPIMIHYVIEELRALGFSPGQIVTTLEAKMKCGMGKCMRCNVGDKYVCKDGPVFTADQISRLLEAF
ncbi:MAG: FAD/NAD(P)-binding protein [Candidatus Bathyarchaeia archaeon]